MLDLNALAFCEQRLSGRPAPVVALRRAAAPAPSAPSEEAMRRCPHLAAQVAEGSSRQELEVAE